MKNLKKFGLIVFIVFLCFFISIGGFLWWNYFPPLHLSFKKLPIHLTALTSPSSPKILKASSYNIHYGIGLDWDRKDKIDKNSFLKRLDHIANILKNIDADIIFLQEVDFNSKRSWFIDQGIYLAKKANYPYIAKAPLFRQRFHPNLHGPSGKINYGICILSRFPLENNIVKIFPYPKEVPFYLRWLYCPHGMQQVNVKIGKKDLALINAHLEPWAQKTREKESKKIAFLGKKSPLPFIIGGDFNTVPPETKNKKGLHLQDAPWFVDKTQWDLENEKTIHNIRKIQGITEDLLENIYKKNEKAFFTFPSNNPKEKLDYIFAGKNAKILYGYVYHIADIASDHLPIVAYIYYQQK